MVQLAKLVGASCVILSEPTPMRREVGLNVGADYVIDPINEQLRDSVEKLTGTAGVDVVIECVGNTVATAQAFDVAKRGATIMLFSVPKAGAIHPLSLEEVFQKELTIMGSMVNPNTHLRATQLINSGRIILDPLITHYYPVDKVKDAILMQMSDESIKVMVGERM